MGSGLSVDADAETAYSFIAAADACARRDLPRVAREVRGEGREQGGFARGAREEEGERTDERRGVAR